MTTQPWAISDSGLFDVEGDRPPMRTFPGECAALAFRAQIHRNVAEEPQSSLVPMALNRFASIARRHPEILTEAAVRWLVAGLDETERTYGWYRQPSDLIVEAYKSLTEASAAAVEPVYGPAPAPVVVPVPTRVAEEVPEANASDLPNDPGTELAPAPSAESSTEPAALEAVPDLPSKAPAKTKKRAASPRKGSGRVA